MAIDTAIVIQGAALMAYIIAAVMGCRVIWKRRRNPPLRDAYLIVTTAALLMVAWRGWTLANRIQQIPIPQPFGLNAAILVQGAIGIALAVALAVALYPQGVGKEKHDG